MRHRTKKIWLRLCTLCLALGFLAGCSAGEAGGKEFRLDGEPKFSTPEYVRTFGPIQLSPYVGSNCSTRSRDNTDEDTGEVTSTDTAEIDMSSLSKGYVVATSNSTKVAKFRIEYGTPTLDAEGNQVWDGAQRYFYALSNTGEYDSFPLAYGSGHYRFTVFINAGGSQYEAFLVEEMEVALDSEFEPFLRPNQIVDYDEDSNAIKLAQTLIEHCVSDIEVVQQIYFWVEHNISYDTSKAIYVKSDTDYLPDLDQILQEGKGICYDYAALVSAMLRSNGIPCKLIMGNVLQDGQDLYHAWNMIWLKDVGWVAVKIPSTPEEWQRLDLTFAASSDASIGEFIGDGTNYTDVYIH